MSDFAFIAKHAHALLWYGDTARSRALHADCNLRRMAAERRLPHRWTAMVRSQRGRSMAPCAWQWCASQLRRTPHCAGIIETQRATRGAAPAIATVLLRDQRARTCKSHLVRSRNLGTCHVHRALGVGGVMLLAAGSQCTCCNKKIGLRLRWMQRAVCNRWWMSSVTRGRTGRMARKKKRWPQQPLRPP
ncbi:hypothetical protein [Xanthomonas arboricola]|uniref:hypothetical protein n=1 Tax=Xanthomonas arboricola TaxID=56448 RepID=UPI001611ECCC|nr:hypothetical protein [Xanthomonas arboricola]MBB3761694.1 hypothetical protein [Xanthomonas arboricola]